VELFLELDAAPAASCSTLLTEIRERLAIFCYKRKDRKIPSLIRSAFSSFALRIPMSSDAIISVENLSKRYIIGHQRDRRDALRHRLDGAMRAPLKWLRSRNAEKKSAKEEFWALKDVSFEVKHGDAVGIIGRNGAGKSTLLKILSRITLLKILSRITEPTRGRITLRGRIASLLEVGTGFHQELTGRENIFLNGAILGMSRAEIKRKFDEIVAFSEVEKFLDTPVKRYSSGMYVRLAFAVAAHLEPEILIVDEVLAVGDASFQKKCLGKMGQVAKGGRTVLFVSHNMAAVRALCNKAIYLKTGAVKAVGDVEPLMQKYLTENGATEGHRFKAPVNLGPALKILSFSFDPNPIESGATLRFNLVIRAEKATVFNDLVVLIDSAQNARVAVLDLRSLGFPIKISQGEVWQVEGEIRSLSLIEGDYSVGITVNTPEFWENVFNLTGFNVSARAQNNGYAPYPLIYRGVVELDYSTTSRKSGAIRAPHEMECMTSPAL
jgi:lipopolysaccharide transport system ATP-binding protein